MNVGCGVFVEIVVLGLLKLKENLPKLVDNARERTRAKLDNDIKELIQAQIKNLVLGSLNEQTLYIRISGMYSAAIDSPTQEWSNRAQETLRRIDESLKAYSDLRNKLTSLVQEIREKSVRYFEDHGKNLAILNNIAGGIKSKAIEPSFKLLESTRDQLSSVKSQVEAIEFD